MTQSVFSTKGQAVIPKPLRDAKGIVAGTKFEAIDHPDGVLLKIVPARGKRPVSELRGMLAPYYSGPPLSVEDMHEGIADWFENDPQWKSSSV